MKRQDVLAELVGSVWHTTNQDRFLRVLECGAILPEPDIPQRWGTAAGSEGHPYVRSIGGVSLFDLRGFEAESYPAFLTKCSRIADYAASWFIFLCSVVCYWIFCRSANLDWSYWNA